MKRSQIVWVSIVAAVTLATPARGQIAAETSPMNACYIPGPAVLYLLDGAAEGCRAAGHVLVTWTGYVDLATLQTLVAEGCADGSVIRSIGSEGEVGCEPDDDSAAGVDFASLQPRITGSCPPDASIRAIAPDGGLECVPDGSAAIAGLQLRVAEACPPGSSVRVIDESGNVDCQIDRVASLTVGPEVSVARFSSFKGSDPENSANLGSAGNRMCMLTQVEFENIDSGGESGECRTFISGSSWFLTAQLGSVSDASAWCSATCVSF